ncbi:Crp/Fnr family transcriptional regulator [Chitinibacter sp. S2-10]|uniref:Crp/Fnr family transcriptional regulator n=1 Tax=Chitinibacter sp. S2-10 TaxID=3373597 RepID=UPI003977CD5A
MQSILSKVELFSGLPCETLQYIEDIATRRHYSKGVAIFCEGEMAESLLILVSGRVRLFHSNDTGREFVYGAYEPGSSFGDLALFANEARVVCAEAEDDCSFLVISRQGFFDLLGRHPEIKDAMLNKAVSHIIRLTHAVSDLALKDVYGRIRKVFEALAVQTPEGGLIDDLLTQQSLADRVGASREMVAKVMKELVAGGYVETARRRILILKKLPENF